MRTLLFVFCLAALLGCKDKEPGPIDPTQTPGYKLYGHIKPADFVGTWEYRIDRDDKEAYQRMVITEEDGKVMFSLSWRSADQWTKDDYYPDQELRNFTDYLKASPVAQYPQFEVLEHLKFEKSLLYRIDRGSPHLQLDGRLYLFKGK